MKINTLNLFTTACLLTFGISAGLMGCADPADNYDTAKVNEAVEIPKQTDNGTDSAPTEGTAYGLDTENSNITFTGSKPTGTHSGGWSGYTGTVTVTDGDFTKATIVIDIDINSMYSDDQDLTDTLLSEKMFDAANFPDAKFVSTSIEAKEKGGYAVSGNLTLHGVTKNITFNAELDLKEKKLTAQSEFNLNRKDFGINYDGLVGDLIREKITMVFYIEAKVAE